MEWLEKNQSCQGNDLHFNIPLMCHCKHLVDICGKFQGDVQHLFAQEVKQYQLSCKILFLLYRGTFRMERDDGFMFDCRIPPFSLESKQDEPSTSGGDTSGPNTN